MMNRQRQQREGARRAGRPDAATGSHEVARRKHGGAWLPWAILGLLALLALGIWAIAQASDDDDDETGGTVAVTTVTTAPGGNAGTMAPGGAGVPTTRPAGAAPGAPGANAGGSLIANGQDVVAAASGGGGLSPLTGAQATGTIRVESVVADEGFWVGPSAEQRVFVFLAPEARGSRGESPFQVAAGQTLNLTGIITALDPTVLGGVDRAEGADQLTQQGHYVRASAIRLAG